ncbi:MAG: putative transport system permease protein [Clostridiales bacterium]|nr:putative transport system permease protein [Clostridiales bacterium]
MYLKILQNDWKRAKLVSIITILFVAISTTLVSLAAIVMVELSGAIDRLMLQAKTPHFMQMHEGEIDGEALSSFAIKQGNVSAYQVVPFLNMDGSEIWIGEHSLASSSQDNGFCTQNEAFDYLLDQKGEAIVPKKGELYVPIAYWKNGMAKKGDLANVAGVSLRVVGFVRDSQMNASLSSSKRFLVSKEDYEAIAAKGSVEYLIEFRLQNEKELAKFEQDYSEAKLPANGPTVTYPLFRMMNAISDGMMIALLILLSLLVLAISFLCIRFTLLAKMEEEYQEIGIMKAIGFSTWEIKRVYLVKYTLLIFLGTVFGFFIALCTRGVVLKNIRLYLGESKKEVISLCFGSLGTIILVLVFLIYINHILSKFQSILPAQVLSTRMEKNMAGSIKWPNYKRVVWPAALFLAIKDIFARKKLYRTILVVMTASTFLLLVPTKLYQTISQKSFIQYMGIGICDLRIDLQKVENGEETAKKIEQELKKENDVQTVAVLITKSYSVCLEDGTKMNIKVEQGNHRLFPVHYEQGRSPVSKGEIAISTLLAKELSKKVGDTLTLLVDQSYQDRLICGIYPDITNGGKTAKAAELYSGAKALWSILIIQFVPKTSLINKVHSYKSLYPYAKVTAIDAYIKETFGQTISSIYLVSMGAWMMGGGLAFLLALLFLKLLLAKDPYEIAVQKALGYKEHEIRLGYLLRIIIPSLVGIWFGSILSGALGERMVGAAMTSFGASQFQFARGMFPIDAIAVLFMLGMIVLAILLGTKKIRDIKIADYIKESL